MAGNDDYQELPDSDLAVRAAAGDSDAFRILYERHALLLLAFLQSRAPRGIAAADVLQDVWVKVWRKLATFDGRHFRGWLFRIAHNRLIDLYREKSGRPLPEGFDVVDGSLDGEDEGLCALRECLAELDDEFVAVIKSRLTGVSVEEIAARLSITTSTVFTRVSRGKERLAECVKKKLS